MKKTLSIVVIGILFISTFSIFAPRAKVQAAQPSDWIRLTTNPSSDCDPTWSPDSTEIVYRAHSGSAGFIWIMNDDGSNQRQLENHGISEAPDVSPDGSMIVFGNYIGSDYFALTMMDYDGTDFHHVYGGGSQGSLERMCWSPSGTRIVSQTTANGASPPYQIVTVNPDGSSPIQLTMEGNNRFPWYSPDGSKIVFASDREGQNEIWIMNSDGANQHRLLDFRGTQPKWSPDGSKIVFVHDNHICIANADGTSLVQLTTSDEMEEFPEISPDGNLIVFAGWVDGLRNIYKMHMPVAPSEQWVQVNENGFGNPTVTYVRALKTFNGYLYAGTGTNVPGGEGWGEVWRSADGLSWEQTVANSFDGTNEMIESMSPFNGYLYVGTANFETGCQIWRSATGDSGTWQKVVSDGFSGGARVSSVYVLQVFEGYLYAGTGGDVYHAMNLWRTFDGLNWEPVTTDGFGDSSNIRLTSACIFGDYLYVGTSNEVQGGEVWRSMTGNPGSWELASHGGFGDRRNVFCYEAAVFQSHLYMTVARLGSAGAMWRTVDGSSWEKVTEDGFGNPSNSEIRHVIAYGDNLWAGTRDCCDMWKSVDGTTWVRSSNEGFGDPNNWYVMATEVFRNSLYVGTWNMHDGCEVWATPPPIRVRAVIDIDPDSLNLQSKGNWITCFVELPDGYDVSEISVHSILLNNTIAVDLSTPRAIGDYDSDGVPDLMVKFNRTEVEQYILSSVNTAERFFTIALTITGKLHDETPFEGSDTIKVIMPKPKGAPKGTFDR